MVTGVIPGPGWGRPSFVWSNLCSFRVCVGFPPADRQLRLNTACRYDCVWLFVSICRPSDEAVTRSRCAPPVAQCQPHTAGDTMKDPCVFLMKNKQFRYCVRTVESLV